MYIKHAVEKEDGTVVFQGVLEGAELAFVLEVGIEKLMRDGVPPFCSTKTHEVVNIHNAPEQKQ
jgi:hypothetical protein